MRKSHIKNLFKVSIISAGVLLALNSYAGNPPPTPPQSNAAQVTMVKQLAALNQNVKVVGNRMQSIAEAQSKAQSSAMPDQNILQSMAANPAVAQNKDANEDDITKLTEQDIQQQLQPFADGLENTGSGLIDSKSLEKRLKAQQDIIKSLTEDIPGSDSIYSNDPAVIGLTPIYQANGELPVRGLTRPDDTQLMDNYFDFGSLIQPMTYDPKINTVDAAQGFITFLTKSYSNPSQGVKFDQFKQKLSSTTDPNDKIYLYQKLMNDPNYRAYQLQSRSAVAARSVSINNFESMVAERTPVKNLGKDAGMLGPKGKPLNDASPLQVSSYLANRRVDNPAWYARVQAASQANVNREILVVLAEIEAQNFQAHMDRERLLATMSAQAATSSSMEMQSVQTKVQALNQDISQMKLPEKSDSDDNNKK